jgi:hypothetical protein
MTSKLVLHLIPALSGLLLSFSVADTQYGAGIQGSIVNEVTSTCA